LYIFDTHRQILRIRKSPCDSDLANKYAKSFGITLLCLSLLSAYLVWNPTLTDLLALAAIWATYHILVIWNNIIHFNRPDIIVHSVFLASFIVASVSALLW
jgi:hypothetical protein